MSRQKQWWVVPQIMVYMENCVAYIDSTFILYSAMLFKQSSEQFRQFGSSHWSQLRFLWWMDITKSLGFLWSVLWCLLRPVVKPTRKWAVEDSNSNSNASGQNKYATKFLFLFCAATKLLDSIYVVCCLT